MAKKHKRLLQDQKPGGGTAAGGHLKAQSHIIGGNSSAIPYRVSRVAQPTQHKSFHGVSGGQNIDENDEDEEFDDTWI